MLKINHKTKIEELLKEEREVCYDILDYTREFENLIKSSEFEKADKIIKNSLEKTDKIKSIEKKIEIILEENKISVELIKDEYVGREVLVVFPEGNTDIPVIIALMENPIDQLVSLEIEDDEKKQEKDFKIDGKQVTIEAENEIVMKCGKASILLRNDGKIIIKGTHLLSRSSGPNRIKGASVGIN